VRRAACGATALRSRTEDDATPPRKQALSLSLSQSTQTTPTAALLHRSLPSAESTACLPESHNFCKHRPVHLAHNCRCFHLPMTLESVARSLRMTTEREADCILPLSRISALCRTPDRTLFLPMILSRYLLLRTLVIWLECLPPLTPAAAAKLVGSRRRPNPLTPVLLIAEELPEPVLNEVPARSKHEQVCNEQAAFTNKVWPLRPRPVEEAP
jgi:hypothetical protein